MKMRTIPLVAAVLASLLTSTGCAPTTIRDQVAKGGAGELGNLGKTILVAKVDLPPASTDRMEKSGRIVSLAGKALEGVPGVEVLPAEVLLSSLQGRDPVGASDSELAAAARAAGADTVVVLQVLGYGGELAVAFPPVYWLVTLDYAYHARVIDARSGALYLDAHRGQRSSRAYAVSGKEALAERFMADFAGLLGDTAGKTGSGS
ncbi:hypothetical protein [Fundidesulfovibrio terrae]|uniref:hypothetical protein n=1 Tax=Fundidesulfovibrio terrae TaxID=2922866 RepID=UPI001FAF3B2B|nr:hypothetical protein [Fundidesulfovibrio terrae]